MTSKGIFDIFPSEVLAHIISYDPSPWCYLNRYFYELTYATLDKEQIQTAFEFGLQNGNLALVDKLIVSNVVKRDCIGD